MVDILTPEQRSAQMSRIRGSDTKLELLVRRALHARGFRYRLGGAGLPGRPDLVLPRYRMVVFVHGCFWHGHACPLFRLPKTRPEFWRDKIESNQSRDERVLAQLAEMGWRACVIWECSLRGVTESDRATIFDGLSSQIRSNEVRIPDTLKNRPGRMTNEARRTRRVHLVKARGACGAKQRDVPEETFAE
ncbi:very short patch repair endonuclease [Lysobacter cavernae]|uniref:Very short patch repair endonuclease n=1 Tax=Lysobacter cavernae TaxID=1685901 RepID=A0ABV7RNJ7_9GAMM